jgi:hypothetical protein
MGLRDIVALRLLTVPFGVKRNLVSRPPLSSRLVPRVTSLRKEAALLGQVPRVADQIRDSMVVTGVAVFLKNRGCFGLARETTRASE